MKRTIYMSEPLERLADETKGSSRRTGGFSRRLGEIVERYQILLDLELPALPKFSETELAILGEVVCGAVIDRRKIRGLYLDVLDAELGTQEERLALSAKITKLSTGARLALIESLGQ